MNEVKKNNWKNQLDYLIDKNGNATTLKPNSINNVQLILENDATLKDTIVFNAFTYEVEHGRDFVLENCHFSRGFFQSHFIDLATLYIEKKYGVNFSQEKIRSAINITARKNEHNQIKTMLEECHANWDKKIRFEDFFPTFLKVEKSEVTTLTTKLFLVGMVAKIFDPSTKFDYCLDLVGGQGSGKTTILNRLSLGHTLSGITSFEDKDELRRMKSFWIVNDDEMVATGKASFDILKRFITEPTIQIRLPYASGDSQFPRNFVLARTSNNIRYLKDRTGERRFLPLKIPKIDSQANRRKLLKSLTNDYIKQLLGEAVALFKSGYRFELTEREEELLTDHREEFKYYVEFELQVIEYVNNLKTGIVTVRNIMQNVFEMDIGNGRYDTKTRQVQYIMENLKGWTYKKNPQRAFYRD